MPSILTLPELETTKDVKEDVSVLAGLVANIEKDVRRAIRNKVHLSIVIPAYNEEKRIPGTLRKVLDYLEDKGYCSEIIIVDDGSTDRTCEVSLRMLTDSVPIRIHANSSNKGKGSAIRKGMLAAKGEYVLFMDADMSTPIDELDRIMTQFREGYDIVIGSRKMPGVIINVHQPKYREIMGKMFSCLSRIMTVRSVHDFTCGFKCFRRACIKKIFSRHRLNGWGYDTEILFIAHTLGFSIKEISVTWSDSSDSKVRLWKDVVRSALDLIRIRINSMLGCYR